MMTLETHRGTGTLRWQAPELFQDVLDSGTDDTSQRNTPATDVYAFALVCYEVSLSPPFFFHFENEQVFGRCLLAIFRSRP